MVTNFLKSLAILLLVFSSVISYAKVEVHHQSVERDACSKLFMTKTGQILPGDALQFAILYSRFVSVAGKEGCIIKEIRLDSEGGSVDEAIEFGRKVREFEFRVMVPSNGSCLSACVLVYAAGVDRVNVGAIGIHRPYFYKISPNASSLEVRKSRDNVANKIKVFLAEIDVSDRLLDDMLSVPPDKMKILTDAELRQYRLDGRDATYDEQVTAKEASEYGLSSSEYRKRAALARIQCTGQKIIRLQGQNLRVDDRNFECEQLVLLGISQAELKRRQDKILKVCMIHENDVPKFRACFNKIRLNG